MKAFVALGLFLFSCSVLAQNRCNYDSNYNLRNTVERFYQIEILAEGAELGWTPDPLRWCFLKLGPIFSDVDWLFRSTYHGVTINSDYKSLMNKIEKYSRLQWRYCSEKSQISERQVKEAASMIKTLAKDARILVEKLNGGNGGARDPRNEFFER
ncbi:MAG: hypothetical protein A3K03_07500 [Bdellovibrionales bacterium RIFOXYD1_FULL_44_7]|nr:MAG: hypothetical protein A3K03_07500 [Bdellovibrionales bacterium RIFOXYD1_FULL_44_7]